MNKNSGQEEIPFSVNWSVVLEKVGEKSIPGVIDWLQPLQLVSQDTKSITLVADSTFNKNWVLNNYLDLISNTIEEIYKRELEIEVLYYKENQKKESQKKSTKNMPREQYLVDLTCKLNPTYSFDKFIVGPSNKFAQGASLAVAKASLLKKKKQNHNPLFIYGGVGLGKTHLINAIGNYVKQESRGELNVCCLSSEEFTNQFIKALKNNSMDDFRNSYRYGCDLLLIDDIQFFAGKKDTQEVFFHTFNALYESNKNIVLTSDKPPSEMPDLQDRLISRFEWGLTVDIQPPEFETRMAILSQKAESESVTFPDDAKMFLAQHIESNVRKLEGMFNKLVEISKQEKEEIDIELVKQVIGVIKRDNKVTKIEIILKEVAGYFDLKISDLKSKSKLRNIAVPRQIAMYLSRKYTVYTFEEIGEKLGGRDHSTISHGFNRIETRIDEDDQLIKKPIKELVKKIEGKIT